MEVNQPDLPRKTKGNKQKVKQTLMKGHQRPLTEQLSTRTEMFLYSHFVQIKWYNSHKLKGQTNTIAFGK